MAAEKTRIGLDGGPAFPSGPASGNWGVAFPGMSLRDYFAAKALPIAWQIEQEAPTGPYSTHMEPTFAGAAARAYYLADALLKARETQMPAIPKPVSRAAERQDARQLREAYRRVS